MVKYKDKAASNKPARGERRHVPKPSDDSVRKAGIVGGWKGWIKSDYEDRIFMDDNTSYNNFIKKRFELEILKVVKHLM